MVCIQVAYPKFRAGRLEERSWRRGDRRNALRAVSRHCQVAGKPHAQQRLGVICKCLLIDHVFSYVHKLGVYSSSSCKTKSIGVHNNARVEVSSVGLHFEALFVESLEGVLDLLAPGEGGVRVSRGAAGLHDVVDQVVD